LLAFCLPVAAQQEELTNLSSSIKDSLLSIKQQSAIISAELTAVQKELEISESERKALEQKSTTLSNSLTNISEQLNNCYKTITRYEQQLKTRMKVIMTMGLVLLILIAMKLLGYFLYWKGIKLPRWLDILL